MADVSYECRYNRHIAPGNLWAMSSQRVLLRLGSGLFPQNPSRAGCSWSVYASQHAPTLPGPEQFHLPEPDLDHLLIIDLNGAALEKARYGVHSRASVFEDLDPLAPYLTLPIVDFSDLKNLLLNGPSTLCPAILRRPSSNGARYHLSRHSCVRRRNIVHEE